MKTKKLIITSVYSLVGSGESREYYYFFILKSKLLTEKLFCKHFENTKNFNRILNDLLVSKKQKKNKFINKKE